MTKGRKFVTRKTVGNDDGDTCPPLSSKLTGDNKCVYDKKESRNMNRTLETDLDSVEEVPNRRDKKGKLEQDFDSDEESDGRRSQSEKTNANIEEKNSQKDDNKD